MSRLLTGDINYRGSNIPIEEYRNAIYARSLYSLDNEYKNTQLFSENGKANLSDSISSILSVIPQYNRFQVNTNLAGNVYDAFRDDGSPLAKIGLIMLGKQIAFNSAMNLTTKYLPTIDVSQALKGNMKGVFKFNQDNTISVKNKEDKTFLDKVGSVASNVLGVDTYDVFGDANPFDKNPTNIDYIRNTGKAQLTRFYDAINMNIYKPVNYVGNSAYAKTFTDYAAEVGVKVDYPRNLSVATRDFFTFNQYLYNPYWKYGINNAAIEAANQAQVTSFSANTEVQEYAPTQDYIDENFGDVKITRIKTLTDFVDTESNISKDGVTDKLIWGRDGLIPQSSENIGQFRGYEDDISGDEASRKDPTDFKIKEGLLEYTKNLLNATEGQFVDITKKAFHNNKSIVGFQGSPLWTAPDAETSKYASDSGNAGKSGIRQHTILDPYGSDETNLDGTTGFAKSIRFKGNTVYNGSDYSVINKNVLPRIHPTMKDGKINNKNLMFSLENLAIGTIKREEEGYGVIDDEDATPIPISEVGPFAGRLMWFPPYNMEINEVASAKYESTVMVGRNEPMYNYMNSERTAILTFTLLVDYPEQLKNDNLLGKDKNKAIADFFAFGGNPIPEEYTVEQLEKDIANLEEQIISNEGLVEQAEPASIKVDQVEIYFQNDKPNINEIDTIIDTMYNNPNHWEIIEGLESAQDGNGWGINEKIYFITGLTKNTTGYTLSDGTPSQYSAIGEIGQYIPCLLNQNLLEVFRNVENIKYYNIELDGRTSKLYNTEGEKAYNEALGDRRTQAAYLLIRSRLQLMFPDIDVNDFKFTATASSGSLGGSASGATTEHMHDRLVKEERAAYINIKRNTTPIENKVQQLNQKEIDNNIKIQQEIQNKTLQLNRRKTQLKENIFSERTKSILTGFEASSKYEYYPVFHSQTPEDFHKRLTFLQQCTRQGAAIRYDVKDEQGKLRAKNSVFGKQPICVLRVGDFFYTKVIIESVTIDYANTTWDMNPEGLGMQPMIADVTLQMKVIGGQSLKGPIDALQNATSFNYYANSTFKNTGLYAKPSAVANKQDQYMHGVDGNSGEIGKKQGAMLDAYKLTEEYKVREGTE